MRGKPLVLKRLENGCIIPTSHKLNADGYFGFFSWCVVLCCLPVDKRVESVETIRKE